MQTSSVRALIVALGGNRAVAAARGVTDKAVSQWAVANELPPSHYLPLWRMALERGLDWEPPGAEGLRPLLCGLPAAQQAAE